VHVMWLIAIDHNELVCVIRAPDLTAKMPRHSVPKQECCLVIGVLKYHSEYRAHQGGIPILESVPAFTWWVCGHGNSRSAGGDEV